MVPRPGIESMRGLHAFLRWRGRFQPMLNLGKQFVAKGRNIRPADNEQHDALAATASCNELSHAHSSRSRNFVRKDTP
jgi:hypothetical protein